MPPKSLPRARPEGGYGFSQRSCSNKETGQADFKQMPFYGSSAAAHSSWTELSISEDRCLDAMRASRGRSSRPSAHTAAPRTNGDRISKQRLDFRSKRRRLGIADRDKHVAQEAIASGAFYRSFGEQFAKSEIVQTNQIQKRGAWSSGRNASLASRFARANLFQGQTARQSSHP